LNVKRFVRFGLCVLLGGLWVSSASVSARPAGEPRQADASAKTLLYADFERTENNRPVSARGGLIQMFAYEESGVHKSTFKGMEGVDPPAPDLVHVKKDDPNHAMKFDFSLRAPNQWAGVTVEIHGQPDVDGKYATDEILRLEAISKGSGKDMGTVYPMMTFKVRPGFNTYQVPLKGFVLPAWANVRVDPKDVFKALTSINLTAFCDQCDFNKEGMVIVDNMIFEK
jgi:hypothetical protein